jgi:hypothetical protein
LLGFRLMLAVQVISELLALMVTAVTQVLLRRRLL